MGFFKCKQVHFSCLDFIAHVTLHMPPQDQHLLRPRGLRSHRGGSRRLAFMVRRRPPCISQRR